MRNIINAYRGTHKPKGDEFVLFWVKGASTQTLDGYMPLSRRYGFIFSDAISSTTNAQHTIAHELGHGAFALDHPWTLIEGLEKGQTQNLMDYAGGTELWKWQWDQLHNPPVMIGYEQEDEEGQSEKIESISNKNDPIVQLIKGIQERFGSTIANMVVFVEYCPVEVDSVAINPEFLSENKEVHSIQTGNLRYIMISRKSDSEVFSSSDVYDVPEEMQSYYRLNWKLDLNDQNDKALLIYRQNDFENPLVCNAYLEDEVLSAFNFCTDELTTEVVDAILEASSECYGEAKVNTIAGIANALQEHLNNNSFVRKHETMSRKEGIRAFLLTQSEPYTIQSAELKDSDKAQIEVKIHYDYDNPKNIRYETKFTEEYITYLKSIDKDNRLTDEILIAIIKQMDELVADAQINICPDGAIDCSSEPLRILQLLNLNLQSIVMNSSIDQAMWRDTDDLFKLVGSENGDWSAYIAGSVDLGVEAGTAVSDLLKTIYEFYPPSKRKALFNAIDEKGFDLFTEMVEKELETMAKEEDYHDYVITKATGEAILFILSFSNITVSKIADIIDNVKHLDLKDAVISYSHRIKKGKDLLPNELENFKKVVKNIGGDMNSLNQIMKRVDKKNLHILMTDLVLKKDLYNILSKNPDLIEVWQDLIVEASGATNRRIRSIEENLETFLRAKDFCKKDTQLLEELKDLFRKDALSGRMLAMDELAKATDKASLKAIIERLSKIDHPSKFVENFNIDIPDLKDDLKSLINKRSSRRDKWIKEKKSVKKGAEPTSQQKKDIAKAWADYIKASEDLGEKSADLIVRSKYGAVDPIKLDLGDNAKQGIFDLMYKVDGKYVFVEAKGGSSKLGTAMVGGKVAQQGSHRYAESTLEKMLKKATDNRKKFANDPNRLKAITKSIEEIKKMQEAFEAVPMKVDYLYVKQPVNSKGEYMTPIVEKFDIRKNVQ